MKGAILIDGDDIMAIAALDMLAQKNALLLLALIDRESLREPLVTTVMSNAGLEAAV